MNDIDFKYKKLVQVFTNFCEQDGTIYFAHLGLILTLLRYPMPTLQELTKFKQGLQSVNSKKEFLLNMCWLDEYDEISLEDIQPSTPFVTESAKSMIYWLFSRNVTIQMPIESPPAESVKSRVDSANVQNFNPMDDQNMVESNVMAQTVEVLDKEALIHFLHRHLSKEPLARFYSDYFEFGY